MVQLIDFARLVRPNSPNTFLVAPDGLCEQAVPDETVAPFEVSPMALYSAVLRLIEAESRWTLQGQATDQLQLSFVATTALLRFKDDVDVLVRPASPGQAIGTAGAEIAIYSRSRVGYSDLGANAKRVNNLIKKLQSGEEGS